MTEKTVNVKKVVDGKDTLIEGVSESYYNRYLSGHPLYSLSSDKVEKPKVEKPKEDDKMTKDDTDINKSAKNSKK